MKLLIVALAACSTAASADLERSPEAANLPPVVIVTPAPPPLPTSARLACVRAVYRDREGTFVDLGDGPQKLAGTTLFAELAPTRHTPKRTAKLASRTATATLRDGRVELVGAPPFAAPSCARAIAGVRSWRADVLIVEVKYACGCSVLALGRTIAE